MKRFHQVLATAAPGDAVTAQAFAWRGLLRLWGHESEIVAEHVQPGFRTYVRSLDAARRTIGTADILGLHYSVWSRACEAALAADASVVLCYHNVTPGELLREFNPRIAELCDRGRRMLPRFRKRCVLAVADSSFNADELAQVGITDAAVVPLLLNLADPPRTARPPRSPPVVLFVGRIAPNKRVEDLINVFRLYQRRHAPDASLILVGSDVGFERYRSSLEQLVAGLEAKNVAFAGRVSREERDDWYRRASVYVSMSVHEGFCAPLLEALAHGLPVVARAAGAVPETLGGAGLLVENGDIELAVEMVHEAASSANTRAALAASARRRIAELRPEVVAGRLRSVLEPILT